MNTAHQNPNENNIMKWIRASRQSIIGIDIQLSSTVILETRWTLQMEIVFRLYAKCRSNLKHTFGTKCWRFFFFSLSNWTDSVRRADVFNEKNSNILARANNLKRIKLEWIMATTTAAARKKNKNFDDRKKWERRQNSVYMQIFAVNE